MEIKELHKAVLTALCQALSDSADSVYLMKYTEDDHIEGVFNFEHGSSYAALQDLSAILCRYNFVIGKIYFGEPTEIHVISWIPERFKRAIAEVCSMFGLFAEDDQTIKDLDVDTIGQIIACAMKQKLL